jgi:N-acetylmuramoyl-L-alanine amidase xlyA
LINSLYSYITGKTLGGAVLNSKEKNGDLFDFLPGFMLPALTKTGQVIKTQNKGLQGYNQFVKNSKQSGIEFKGINWQQKASKSFRIKKINQQALEDY